MNKQLDQLLEEWESKGITCIKEMLNPCGMRTSICRREHFLGALSIKAKRGRWYTVDVTPWCEVTVGKDFSIVDYQNQYTVPETILFYFTEHTNDSGKAYFKELWTRLFQGDMPAPQAPVLLADKETFSIDGKLYTEQNIITGTDDLVFEAKGGNVLPVTFKNPSVQQKGQCISNRAEVYFDHIPALVYLHAEDCKLKQLAVNGQEIISAQTKKTDAPADIQHGATGQSQETAAWNVTGLLKVGMNILEAEYQISGNGDSEYDEGAFDNQPTVFFRGNFRVDSRNRAVAPKDFITYGSWEKQGYPYFEGEGIYKTRINVHGMDNDNVCRPWKKAVLQLHTHCAASIYVNGQYVADSKQMSHEIDVTKLLHDNTNEVTLILSPVCSKSQQIVEERCEKVENKKINGLLAPIQIVLYN